MRAYEGAFDEAEVLDWLRNQQRRYREEGRGLWAVLLKDGGEMIGQCGLTYQSWGERRVLEVGYLFERDFWHRGYATEAARACRDYAFDRLGAQEVFSIIRDSNFASQAVARRNGMTLRGDFVKHYRGVDMPHLVFSIRREERDGEAGAAVAGGGTLHIRAYDPADLPEMTAIWNAVVEGGNAFPQRRVCLRRRQLRSSPDKPIPGWPCVAERWWGCTSSTPTISAAAAISPTPAMR